MREREGERETNLPQYSIVHGTNTNHNDEGPHLSILVVFEKTLATGFVCCGCVSGALKQLHHTTLNIILHTVLIVHYCSTLHHTALTLLSLVHYITLYTTLL